MSVTHLGIYTRILTMDVSCTAPDGTTGHGMVIIIIPDRLPGDLAYIIIHGQVGGFHTGSVMAGCISVSGYGVRHITVGGDQPDTGMGTVTAIIMAIEPDIIMAAGPDMLPDIRLVSVSQT